MLELEALFRTFNISSIAMLLWRYGDNTDFIQRTFFLRTQQHGDSIKALGKDEFI